MVELTVDGEPLTAPAGQSIAAVLINAGRPGLRRSPTGQSRGVYCGIGVCQECRVVVGGLGIVRACVTPVTAGMTVSTGYT